jgi:O-antigen/teichoic acid export membrane protein
LGRSIRLRLTGWLPTWTGTWARDGFVLLFSQFTAVLATTLLAILLTRSLGPSDWGIFSGFLGLSLAFSTVVNFGVSQWLMRELSRVWVDHDSSADETRKSVGELIGGGLLLNTSLGVTLIAGTLVSATLLGLSFTLAVALISLMAYAALSGISAGFEPFFRARRKLRFVVAGVLLEKILLVALVAVAIAADWGVPGIAVMYVVAGLVRAGFYGANLFPSRLIHISLSIPSLGRAARESMPFVLNGVSLNIIPRLDTFILATLSATAAGYFAIGDRVVGPAVMIPWVMTSALYPFLARERGDTSAGWKLLGLFAGVGTLLAVCGVLLAPTMIPLLFGEAYEPAVAVTQIMILATPFIYGNNLLLAQLYTSRRERSVLGATIGTSVFGTVAIVVGQLTLGPTGAASGYVIRQLLFLVGLIAVAFAPIARNRGRRAEDHVPEEPIIAPPAGMPRPQEESSASIQIP